MDAFEQVVAELLRRYGYWVHPSFWVEIPEDDEEARQVLGRYVARINIDLVAYRPGTVLVVECKSFMDSRGVQVSSFVNGGRGSSLYKMFTNVERREVVLRLLQQQLRDDGLIPRDGDLDLELCLACGNIAPRSRRRLKRLFRDEGWRLLGPTLIRGALRRAARGGYTNSVTSIVAKLLRSPERRAPNRRRRG